MPVGGASMPVVFDCEFDRKTRPVGCERKTSRTREEIDTGQATFAPGSSRRTSFLANLSTHRLPDQARRGTYNCSPDKYKETLRRKPGEIRRQGAPIGGVRSLAGVVASQPVARSLLAKEVAPQPVGKPHGVDGHEREHEYFAGEYKSLLGNCHGSLRCLLVRSPGGYRTRRPFGGARMMACDRGHSIAPDQTPRPARGG